MKQIFAAAIVLISMHGFAQKTAGSLSFQKGKKLEMVAQTKAVILQEVMGQSMDINVSSTIVRSFDVEDVSNGTARIEHKIKRLQFGFDVMGQQQSFDSDKEEDLKGEMGKSLEKSLKNKYSMMVDAGGKIVSVKPDDDNPNKSAEEKDPNDMMGNMMAQFAEGLEMPKAGDDIALKVSTKGKLTKGQSWTDSLPGIEKGTLTYTVADVTGADVLIDYISEGSTQRSQEVGQGVTMDVNMKSKTTGKITLDKKTGLLKQRTIESQGSGTMEVSGQSIPMSSKVSGTITVNGL